MPKLSNSMYFSLGLYVKLPFFAILWHEARKKEIRSLLKDKPMGVILFSEEIQNNIRRVFLVVHFLKLKRGRSQADFNFVQAG